MVDHMIGKTILAVSLCLLLYGCTMNPQDTVQVAGTGTQNGSGTTDSSAANGAQNQSAQSGGQKILSMEEVAKHSTKDDCWQVIYGKVVDLTGYTNHPGGETYVPYCGKEATAAFETEGSRGRPHSAQATTMLDQFLIGELGQPMK
jgi:cytochrome b involved in lipid metabolism